MYRQRAIIADVAAARGLVDIKQASLLFDQIQIVKTPEGDYDRQWNNELILGTSADEVEWLSEKGVISTIDDLSYESLSDDDPRAASFREYRRIALGHVLLSTKTYEVAVRASANFIARYASAHLNRDTDDRIVPLTFDTSAKLGKFTDPFAIRGDKYHVASAVVLSRILVPEVLTPWEDILAFRADRGAQAAFYNLRKYIASLSDDITPAVLRDEIEHNLHVTETALKRAKVEYHNAVLETVVVGAVGVIENLVKFKWSEIPKSFFAIRKSRSNYLAAEAKIAENSTYYIAKANSELAYKPE